MALCGLQDASPVRDSRPPPRSIEDAVEAAVIAYYGSRRAAARSLRRFRRQMDLDDEG